MPGAAGRPTVVVRHRKERRSKCSLTPLEGRDDVLFLGWPLDGRPDSTACGYVRLAIDGPPLGARDAAAGILLVDATWRYAEAMQRDLAVVPPRSIGGFETAYPRRSKLFDDPEDGLASIEALYAAYVLTGRDPSGLLDAYRWREAFLSKNDLILRRLLEGAAHPRREVP